MLHMRTATGATGAPFLVVLDTEAEDDRGRKLGRVLWFDTRRDMNTRHPDTGTPFTVAGQFVSDYYASTLMDRERMGLNLHGGEPSWVIGTEQFAYVQEWIADCYSREGRTVPQD